jgi:uncharacterized protein (TIGR02001 family)
MRSFRPAAWLVAVAVLASARLEAQGAAGVNGYVTLATGYYKRGLAQTDDGLALRLGADYRHPAGFFGGAELADVDYELYDLFGEDRETEVGAYLGFHRRNSDWSWTLTLARYLHPDAGRYDYSEIAASVGFRDRVFLSSTYVDELYWYEQSALNTELSVTFPLAWNFEIGAGVGRLDWKLQSGSEYTHWNVGLSKVVRRVVLDLRYYDNGYDVLTALGDPASDHYVLSASYGFRGARRFGR